MNPTLSQQVIPADDVLFQEVGSECVLLKLASESYFGLDPIGTRIWTLLRENTPLQRIHDVLLQE
jgi:hypothetical protein